MSEPMGVFDRRAVRAHRERAAAGLGGHDFLLHDGRARGVLEALQCYT